MKKTMTLTLLLLLFAAQLAAQRNSRNGYEFPTSGGFRVLVVFAETTNNPLDTVPVSGWPAGQLPDNPASFIDHQLSADYSTYFSRYFSEASFNNLHVIGDYFPQLIQIPYSSGINDSYPTKFINAVTNEISSTCNGQQVQTPHGFSFPNDFDSWTFSTVGYPKSNIPDGKVDCLFIFWRLAAKNGIGMLTGGTSTAMGNKAGTNYRFIAGALNIATARHEFSHGILGNNTFHSGGANSGNDRIYMQNYGGYSMLSGWNRMHESYNGWDRYWLGWKPSTKQHYISARTTGGQETVGDLVYGQSLPHGDSAVYVLRNFAASGDAVRIKLPYLQSENTAVKEQWLWLENHQFLEGTIEYSEWKHGVNSPMHKIPKGIYINIQVGNDIHIGNNIYSNSGPNSISPISRFGNYDFSYSGNTAYMSDQTKNPFTGVGFTSFHPADLDGDDKILCKKEEISHLTFNFNGTAMNKNNWAVPLEFYMGSVFDTFYQGDKIAVATNPSSAPRLTYNSDAGYANSTPKNFDNRKIYLNGLCVRVLEQLPNGDVKISVRWNDFKISNDVRWCGDIVLNEQLDIHPNATVLLD